MIVLQKMKRNAIMWDKKEHRMCRRVCWSCPPDNQQVACQPFTMEVLRSVAPRPLARHLDGISAGGLLANDQECGETASDGTDSKGSMTPRPSLGNVNWIRNEQ